MERVGRMTHREQTERERALAALQPPPRPYPHFYLDDAKAEAYIFGQDGDKKPTGRRMKALRRRGGGPRYVRLGLSVRYRSDWLDEWTEAKAVTSTAEEIARRRE
jgi:hypothetical protein